MLAALLGTMLHRYAKLVRLSLICSVMDASHIRTVTLKAEFAHVCDYIVLCYTLCRIK